MAMPQQPVVKLKPVEVPSVQELAKTNLGFVPPRYIQRDKESLCMSNATSQKEIPVIDMQLLLSENGRMNSELQKMDFACKEWGIFQLINHGVSTSLLEKWKLQIRDFFNLPPEEKKKLQLEGIQGFGQTNIESEEQKLDWGDAFNIVTLPIPWRRTELFSKLPSPFRETLEAYAAEIKSLNMKILNQMAKALEMKLEDVKLLYEDGMESTRINYYPPCPQPDLVTGINVHSDCNALTFVLQVTDHVDGLEVRKDGTWLPVSPLPNAFIVTIGDLLEIMTNGIYKSVIHRASVNKEEARISIASFHSPSFFRNIGPAPSLITLEAPPKFKTKSVEDHLNGCYPTADKSYIDSVRI